MQGSYRADCEPANDSIVLKNAGLCIKMYQSAKAAFSILVVWMSFQNDSQQKTMNNMNTNHEYCGTMEP